MATKDKQWGLHPTIPSVHPFAQPSVHPSMQPSTCPSKQLSAHPSNAPICFLICAIVDSTSQQIFKPKYLSGDYEQITLHFKFTFKPLIAWHIRISNWQFGTLHIEILCQKFGLETPLGPFLVNYDICQLLVTSGLFQYFSKIGCLQKIKDILITMHQDPHIGIFLRLAGQ